MTREICHNRDQVYQLLVPTALVTTFTTLGPGLSVSISLSHNLPQFAYSVHISLKSEARLPGAHRFVPLAPSLAGKEADYSTRE